jgi:glycerol dehydrogenase
VLQNSPMEEIETVLGFCQKVGLPVTLAQMGVKEGSTAKSRGGESHLRGR